MLGVYIHIPFCESKCHYCAFASFVRSEEEQEKYINSLIGEIENFAKREKREIDSIYIGGGTPSIISISLMKKLFDALKDNFKFNKNLEWTIEANPCSLTEEKLKFYKQNGVNRLSLGIQSLEDAQLQAVGRRHSGKQAMEKVQLASRYFENLSCDLLIGLPEMDKDKFLQQINWLCLNNVKHISAYMLQVEGGTPLVNMIDNKDIFLPDDDECIEVYDHMVKNLKNMGYQRYEVSNFAKEGYESRHNFKYWTGEDYVGFGLGAHSYLNGIRFANSSTFDGYYQRKLAQKEILTNNQKIEEHIMLGLRCKAGIDKEFLDKMGYNIEENEYFDDYIEKNILIKNNNKIKLNEDFYGVNNYIIASLIP